MAEINESLKRWAESRGITSLPSTTNESLLKWAASKALQESKSEPVEVQWTKLASTPSKTVTAQEKAVQEHMDSTTPSQRLAEVKSAVALPIFGDLQEKEKQTVESEIPTLVQANVQNIDDKISALEQEKSASTGNRLQTGLTVAQSQAKAKEYDAQIDELKNQRAGLQSDYANYLNQKKQETPQRALSVIKSELTAAKAAEQSAMNKLNEYMLTYSGALDMPGRAEELQALKDAATAATSAREELEKEYNNHSGSFEDQFGEYSGVEKAAMGIIGSPLYAMDVIGQTAKSALTGDNSMDMDTLAMQNYKKTQQLKSSATENLSGAGKFLADTGISIAQNLYGLPMNVIAPGASLAVMGAGAAADKMVDVGDSGGSATSALVRGAVSGGIEALTEKLPLDSLADLVKTGGKTGVKNLLKQGGVEATEEGLSYVMNYIADKAAKDPDATWDWAEFANSVASGGLSGLFFGLGGTAVNRVNGTISGLPIANQNSDTSAQQPATLPIREQVNTDAAGAENAVEGVSEQNKTASTGETEYRAVKPENVEMPTVPIINLSMQDVADLNRGELPNTGNYIRKTATEQTVKRLGLDKNPAVYIEASNVTRNGDAYVIKITKQSLKKMLSASSYSSGVVPLESIAVLNQIERIAQNGVYYQSEGDRYGRDQIAGYDHLMTTVYIDHVPYVVDMRVRVADQPSGNGNTLYHFTPETIEVTRKNDSDISATGRHASSIKLEIPLSSDPNILKNEPGVKNKFAQSSDILTAAEQTNGPRVLPVREQEGVELPVKGREAQSMAMQAEGNERLITDAGVRFDAEGNPITAESSVGAATTGFDPYSNMISEYGIIPEGEDPARMVDVPKSTNGKDRVSYTARTAMEAEATPDSMVGELGESILAGDLSYIPISNKQAEAKAKAALNRTGDFTTAVADWTAKARSGSVSAEMTAMGALLYNEAANSGDTKLALSILGDYATMVRHGAQAVQAARILKKLSPENKIFMIRNTVDKMNERKISTKDNVAVEQWMQRVGEDLASALESKAEISKESARTVSQEILSDLKNYANQVMPSKGKARKKTADAKFYDLLNNWTQYSEAIDAARDKLHQDFADKPAALEAFNKWLNTSANTMLVDATGVEGNIVVDETLIDEYLKAQTDEARDAALDKIYQNIADQIPSTLMEKFTALRYLNMLGNLKTQVRNVMGNLGNIVMRDIDHHLQAIMQAAVYRGDRKTERTTAFVRDKEIAKLARQDFDDFREMAMGETKYSPIPGASGNIGKEIDDRRTVFKSNGTWGTKEAEGIKRTLPVRAARFGYDKLMRGLDIAQSAVSWAMDTGDEVFVKFAYAETMSRYLKAKGYTAEQWQNNQIPQEVLDDARYYSIKEAQEATFRDNNQFAEMINRIGFKDTNNKWMKAGNAVIQGVLPFRKTPANVAVQAEKHSPLGIINTAYMAVQANNPNSDVTGTDVIKSLSETLTGSGLFILGMALAARGLATGSPDDEEAIARLDDLQGFQEYSLMLGGKWRSYDFLTPEAMPFGMGVELQNAIERNGGALNGQAVRDALGGMTEVMISTSMLSGVNDALEDVKFSEYPVLEVGLNSLLSYVQQGLTSTLGGQIERMSESERMTTFVDRVDSGLSASTQRSIGKVLQKLPGDYNQIPYVDAWGRTEGSGNLGERAYTNFVSPYYSSEPHTEEAETEIRRLAELGYTKAVPNYADQSHELTWKDDPEDEDAQKRYMSQEEYLEYAITKGQKSLELANSIVESDFYNDLTDEEKANVLSTAYTYAGHLAEADILGENHPMDKKYQLAQTAEEDLGVSEADYLLLCELYGTATVNGDKVREAYALGMDAEDYLSHYVSKSEYNEDGEGTMTIGENAQYVRNSGMSQKEQEIYWCVLYPEWPEKAEKAGVDISAYIQYQTATYGVTGDKDKDGNTVAGSKKSKIVDIINGMNVSKTTKDALYLAEGYAESGLEKTPWNEK